MPEVPDRTRTPDADAADTSSNADPTPLKGADSFPTLVNSPSSSASRYELGEEIAHGGMGVVYRATDTTFGREVALKVLREKYGLAGDVVRRFTDEAWITGQLQHPAIPPVHDRGTLPDGRPFLAMKLIRGRNLDQLLAERPDPAHERGRFVAVFEKVCEAVAYAHAHKVLHRDLKPANVMVGNYGEVQVMDWGLAKVVDARKTATGDPWETSGETAINSLRESDGSGTQAGSVLGTPAFMPPEQALGVIGKIDPRSDVFGLGAVLAVILTGKPPFGGSSAETMRIQAAQGNVEECFVRLDGCGADPELVGLCKRCLAPQQDKRPAHAGEVAQAVADLRAAADERARRADLDRVKAEGEKVAAAMQADEQRKRRRVQRALAVAVGVLLLGAGTAAWWQDRQTSLHRAEAEGRERDERERLGRNAEALAALLDQSAEALRAGDSAKAAVPLGAAERRATEGGAQHLAGRLDAIRADLGILRNLEAVDQFRWTPVENMASHEKKVAVRYREALGRFAANPEVVAPEEAASRVSASLVRDRLVAALDRVLRAEKSDRVWAALRVVDPDSYRDAVRDAVRADDPSKVAELARQPAALGQPPEFVAVLGENEAVPVERRRELLGAAARRRPGEMALLMALGWTYPVNQREGADEQSRWFQAAVAVAPANAAAHTNLGVSLLDKGDVDGAIAEYEESLRLDPRLAATHNNLGWARQQKGDLDGAIVEYKEANHLDPNLVMVHNNLGWALQQKGDLDGAIVEFKEAIRLDPRFLRAHNGLAWSLQEKGDLDGAIAAFKKSLRIDPMGSYARVNLPKTERMRELFLRLPGIRAGTDTPATPAEACAFANLCRQPFQRRYLAAVRLFEGAFAVDPTLAADLVAYYRYDAVCSAAQAARGDGVDAPADPGARTALRAKALGWLQADLALWKKQAASASATERKMAVDRLSWWLHDTDLSEVRPGMPRMGMAEEERAAWDALWADVKATIAEAQKSAPPAQGAPLPPKG